MGRSATQQLFDAQDDIEETWVLYVPPFAVFGWLTFSVYVGIQDWEEEYEKY